MSVLPGRRLPLGLSARLVLLFAALVASVGVAIGAIGALATRELALRHAELRAGDLAEVLARALEPAVDFGDAENAAELLASLDAMPEAEWAELRLEDGTVLASRGVRPTAGHGGSNGIALPERLEVQRPLETRSGARAILSISFRMHAENEVFVGVLRWSASATLLLLAFGVLAAALAGRLLSAPLGRLTGVAESVIEGREPSLLAQDLVRTDELGLLARALDRMLQHQAKLHGELEGRVAGRTADLGRVNGELEVTNAELALRLTELRKVHEQLVVEDRRRSIGQLAAGVAHEINNPLAFVLGNVRFVTEELVRLAVEPELIATLGEVERGCERMRIIVQGLTTFSRGDDDRKAPIDLRRAVESAVAIAMPQLRHRARVEVQTEEVPSVLGSEIRLSQVILNLLVNAGQACSGPADRNLVKLCLRRAPPGFVELEVSDTGAGIPAEVLPRLFEPFFTTKPVGQGTGLGLSICHGIVQSLGGTIEIDSAPGRGARFLVRLPAEATVLVAAPARGPLPSRGPAAPRRGRVLIIDDEPLIGAALRRELQKEHEVILARSGREGLQSIRDNPAIDVVLCDLMMPDLSGIEVHGELLRHDPALAGRAIFMSGGAVTDEARAFVEAEARRCIDKPIDMRRLRTLLAERLVIAALVALCALPAGAEPAAESAPLGDELSLEELLAVELVAPNRIPTTVRVAPGTATLVTRDQIRTFGWASLEELLASQPGFFLGQNFDRVTVGLRGVSQSWNGNHVLVLLDGVPLDDAESGGLWLAEEPPLFLARDVTILRGPASALYGSGATSAVIELRPVRSARLLGAGDELEVASRARVELGTGGETTIEALVLGDSRRFGATVGLRLRRSDGNEYDSYDLSGRRDEAGALRRFRSHDERRSTTAYLRLEGRDALPGLTVQLLSNDVRYEAGLGWSLHAPDHDATHEEQRNLLSLTYRHGDGAVRGEHLLRLQRHTFDLDARIYPEDSFPEYPRGVTEQWTSTLDELLLRPQLLARLGEAATLIAGLELRLTSYSGDDEHWATADPDTYAADPQGRRIELPGLYAPMEDRPYGNAAAFAQLVWPDLGLDGLTLTAGARADLKYFEYVPEDEPDAAPRSSASWALSPRLSLVWDLSDAIAAKLQLARAFRAPSLDETIAAHTFTLYTDVAHIRPETVTSLDAGLDLLVVHGLTLRPTLFLQRYTGQIGYPIAAEGAVTNLRDQTLAGGELEALGERALGPVGIGLLFASVSHTRLLAETDYEPELSPHAAQLSGAPDWLAKAGLALRRDALTLGLRAELQGPVTRYDGERGPLHHEVGRPAEVPAFVLLGANLRWQATGWAAFGLRGTNLLDEAAFLYKSGDAPFDYRLPGRRLFASVELGL